MATKISMDVGEGLDGWERFERDASTGVRMAMADATVAKHAARAHPRTLRRTYVAWTAAWIVGCVAGDLWWNRKILLAALATLAALKLGRWAHRKVSQGARHFRDARVQRTMRCSSSKRNHADPLTVACRNALENMLVMQGVGIQLETEYVLGGKDVVFLDRATIETVVLNEAVTTTEAFYYLAILLHGESSTAVAFETLRPGRSTLLPALQTAAAMGFF